MFDRQYFEHESPTGINIDDLAEESGYKFIVIGENLALGNFKDDQALVDGWMNSPPHRENILNGKYTEIGVAVGRGLYQGKDTWLAVQHFGKPLSDCPSPDPNLKTRIEALGQELSNLEEDLAKRREEIDNYPMPHDEVYDQKVSEYNSGVEAYNQKAEEYKKLVDDYNEQVEQFNSCAL